MVGEMATQVETRLPGNPLAKAEEHGKVIHAEADEEEGGRDDGARQQAGVGGQGSNSSGSNSSLGVGQAGNPVTETSGRLSVEELAGGDSDDKPNEESTKGCDRKEFAEAPPPKVNPWTRKMNAVTVVSVNGQAHHGLYTPFSSLRVDFGWPVVFNRRVATQVRSHQYWLRSLLVVTEVKTPSWCSSTAVSCLSPSCTLGFSYNWSKPPRFTPPLGEGYSWALRVAQWIHG